MGPFCYVKLGRGWIQEPSKFDKYREFFGGFCSEWATVCTDQVEICHGEWGYGHAASFAVTGVAAYIF